MKYLLIFLLSISAFAQDVNHAVISVEKANIVYRGIDNLIKVAVPGADDVNVTASGGSLKPVEGQPGAYLWNVTAASGTMANILVTYKQADGKAVAESKEFRIMNIGRPYPYIGKYHSGYQHSYTLTRQGLANIEINSKIDDFTAENKYLDIVGFTLYLPKDTLYIEGNRLPENMKEKIYSLQTGAQVIVEDIRRYNPHSWCFMGLPPLTIEIVDDPLPVTKKDIPMPVIYNTRYETVYRGLGNHFSISVPGAKSYTVTGPGVKQYHDSFDLNLPGDYKENRVFVDVEAITKTDSVVKYHYMFIPKDISVKMLINGQGCEKCIVQQTLAELKDATVSVEYPDISPFNVVYVKSFQVIFPDGKIIEVTGDKINEAVYQALKKLNPGELITIDKIYYYVPGVNMYTPKHYPIKIMLVN